MKIRRIDIIPLNIPLVEPFEISLGVVTHAENTVIKIYAEDLVGYGESSPFASILGETQSTQLVLAEQLAKALLGKNVLSIADLIKDMDNVIYRNHGIKSAFDLALYDLNAKHENIPLYQYLGGVKNKKLTTDMTIGMSSTEKMLRDAERFCEQGFDAIKVKVGLSSDEDIKRIANIRQIIGDHRHLRIDANQGYNIQDALKTLEASDQYQVEHCEEPIPSWNLRDQQILNGQSPVPIMADESLFDHQDAQRLVDFNACSQFNIKLAKSGGIHKATKIINIAKTNNISCQVGCFSETRLGISALAHFAIANDEIIHYDMDSPLMLVDDPIQGGIRYQNGQEVIVVEDPGIGATLDMSYIDPTQIKTIE